MLDPLSGVRVVIGAHRRVRAPHGPAKSFTAYQLSVYRSAAFTHAVEKRYSDFEKLHRLLRAASPRQYRLPELPAKLLASGSPVENDRSGELEAYANTVLACFQHNRSAAPGCASLLCKFLGIEHRSPTHSSCSGSGGWDASFNASRPDDWSLLVSAKTQQQQQQQQHQPVVLMPEVELVPRAELDLLTYTVIDTVYQSSGSSSVDD